MACGGVPHDPDSDDNKDNKKDDKIVKYNMTADGGSTLLSFDHSHCCRGLVVSLPPLLACGGAPHDPDSDKDKDNNKDDKDMEYNDDCFCHGSIPPCSSGSAVE